DRPHRRLRALVVAALHERRRAGRSRHGRGVRSRLRRAGRLRSPRARKTQGRRMVMIRRTLFSAAALAAPLFASESAHARATCFGEPESAQTQGLNGAIVTLLILTYTILGAMAFGVFLLVRRGRQAAAEAEADFAGDRSHG